LARKIGDIDDDVREVERVALIHFDELREVVVELDRANSDS